MSVYLYDMPEWIEPVEHAGWSPPAPQRCWKTLSWVVRKLTGKEYFEFVIQIEPADGDTLEQLAVALSGPLDVPVSGIPKPGHRAMFTYGTFWAKSEAVLIDKLETMLEEKVGHVEVGDAAIKITQLT